MLLALVVSAAVGHARAAGPAAGAPNASDVAAQRQAILTDMLGKDAAPTVAAHRWVCAMGQEPAKVAEVRAQGASFFPDAADSCVAALTRMARDRQLPTLYGQLLTELGGGQGAGPQLPNTIGAVVMNGATKAPIGNGKSMVVTPALAFDAGFTVAYQQGAAEAGPVNIAQLKAVAEDCLSQRRDAATCFSVGHAQGARAFKARTASVR